MPDRGTKRNNLNGLSFGDSSCPVPSSLDLGKQAQMKGDFRAARKFFRAALQNLESEDLSGQQPLSIELMAAISDCYTGEGRLAQAGAWCDRALRRAEMFFGGSSLQLACLLVRRARLHVLRAELPEFEECYESIKRIYLLSPDGDISGLIAPLSDLVMTLCSQHHQSRAQEVNDFVNQIEQLDAKDRLQDPSTLAG